MRRALVVGLAFLGLGAGVAVAQQQRGDIGIDRPRERSGYVATPVPPCPDLTPGIYTYVSEIPNGEPLAPGEVALQWTVGNEGTAPYVAANATAQSLALEYVTASGVHELAVTPLPAANAQGQVVLGHRQTWRGYMRVQMTPEAMRRTLRLHVRYAGDGRTSPNDCDLTNNEVTIMRPTAAPAVAATPSATAAPTPTAASLAPAN
jgi:hypothetical protein